MFFSIGQLVGADASLKLAGHRQKIEDEQIQLSRYAAAALAACKNPQLKELGQWYMYIATLRMP